MKPQLLKIPGIIGRSLVALLPILSLVYLYLYLGGEKFDDVDYLPKISLITPSGPGFADLDEVSVYNPLFLLCFLLTLVGTMIVPKLPKEGRPIGLEAHLTHAHLYLSYMLNIYSSCNCRFTHTWANSPFSLLTSWAAGLVGTGKRLVSRENNKTSPNASKPLEATPATVLPGTAILLFINCAYIFYKFKVYDLYNRDDASLIYKITGNTLGKIGTINFGLFLIPVSTFSPSLAALGLSQEIAYAFHRSAAILAVIEIVVHGIFHTLSYHITRKESMAEYGAPTFTQWTVWPAKICYGEDAEGPDYECHACSCYHTKANVVGFWSLLFMLVVCFTSTPQIRRNWYKVFYWCHVIFALPALLLMLMHWSGMIGYFIPSLIIWGLSKSLQVFESLSIVLQGGTKVLDNALVPNAKLAEITLPFAGSPFVPGQFVRLSLVTLGANLSIFEPSHPYTIASSPSTGFVKILYASGKPRLTKFNDARTRSTKTNDLALLLADTKFGRRLCQLGNSDKRSSLVCRGYFGPNDRYDRIHAAAHSPPNNLEKGVLIVAGGVGVTPYLSILSQVRKSEERSDELARPSLVTKMARTRTPTQVAPSP